MYMTFSSIALSYALTYNKAISKAQRKCNMKGDTHMANYTSSEREYVSRMGWTIKEDGLIHLTGKQFSSYQYTGKSLRNPSVRTLQICTGLLYEGRHFIVEG